MGNGTQGGGLRGRGRVPGDIHIYTVLSSENASIVKIGDSRCT